MGFGSVRTARIESKCATRCGARVRSKMLDKSIANSLAKLVGLKALLALSRSTTLDQRGQDLTGTPQLQRSFSCIQRSKNAISLSARISGWAPRIMVSTVEPLCPEPTTKTKRRGDRLPVEE